MRNRGHPTRRPRGTPTSTARWRTWIAALVLVATAVTSAPPPSISETALTTSSETPAAISSETPAARVARARNHERRAAVAYRTGDVATFLGETQAALDLRPGHPLLLYNLACAEALSGQSDRALARLERFAAMGLVADAAADDDLSSLRDLPRFGAVVERLAVNATRHGRSTPAFTLDDPTFIDSTFVPEGIAFDPHDRRFLIGGVHARAIVRVDSTGHGGPFVTTREEPGLWSVLGLAVDAPRRRLWVTTAALPETPGIDSTVAGRSALVAFDLDRGVRLAWIEPPAGEAHELGDLCVAASGAVFVSSSTSGAILHLPPGADRLEVVLAPGILVSPQGIAVAPDGRHLLVADYSTGLHRIDPGSGDARALACESSVTLLGIDGLVCRPGELVAIQNGVRPHRVLRLGVDDDATRVTAVEILEAGHPAFDEPTLGTLVDDRLFYFVANSGWSHLDRHGGLSVPEALTAPVILVVEL